MTSSEEPSSKRTRWTFDEPCLNMERSVLPSTSIIRNDANADALSKVDLTIVGVYKYGEDDPNNTSISYLSPSIRTSLLALAAEHKTTFKAAAEVGSKTPTLRTETMKRYVLLGLGPKDQPPNGFALGASVANICDEEKGCESCLVVLPTEFPVADAVAKDFTTSFRVSLYSDNRYRTGDNIQKPAERLKRLYMATTAMDASLVLHSNAAATKIGNAIADGQMLTMDIVNAPHNVLNSESLANVARSLESKTLTCRILGKKECEMRGMGSYLAVARGSETEPQFIHLTYNPPRGEVKQKVGIVGKGVTFDTGGYNVKQAMMELMKFDCGGSAAVLGAAMAVDALQPPGVEAHFIIPACENMISSKAYVPSDVLTASNGKTIEVLNTDAEGRLTLADALVYADKEVGCDRIIELSTLTGSCIVSLGQKICGIWCENDDLAKELEDISKATGEKSWRMPLEKQYNEQLKSSIADIKNIGGKWGGSITAALFLQNFVEKDKPFAHIDIAGPAWDWEKKCASGFGVRLVTEWICRSGT